MEQRMISEVVVKKYKANVFHVGNGHYYYIYKSKGNRAYLRCTQNMSCPGRASMPRDPAARTAESLIFTRDHSHGPRPYWLEVTAVRGRIMHRCASEKTPVRLIHKQETEGLHPDIVAELPFKCLHPSMLRARRNPLGLIPATLQEHGAAKEANTQFGYTKQGGQSDSETADNSNKDHITSTTTSFNKLSFCNLDHVKKEIQEVSGDEKDSFQSLQFSQVFIKEELEGDEIMANYSSKDDQELATFNIHENIEFNEENVKPEPHPLEINMADTDEKIGGHYQSKAPAKTYTPTFNHRKRPASWGSGAPVEKEAKITVKEVEDIVQQNLFSLRGERRNEWNNSKQTKNKSSNHKNSSSTADSTITVSDRILTNVNESMFTFTDKMTDNKRKSYNRYHNCYYCKRRQLHMQKHLVVKHSDEIDMKLVIEVPECSHSRMKHLVHIQRMGDFLHNIAILQNYEEQLIVLRPSEVFVGQVNRNCFVPCPDCTGFVYQSHLRQHHKTCIMKQKQTVAERRLKEESQALLLYSCKEKEILAFERNFFNELNGTFVDIAKEDELLILLGRHMFAHNKSVNVAEKVRTTMHEMGYLLSSCRMLADNSKLKFHQLLVREQLRLLIKTVRSVLITRKEDLEMFELHKTMYHYITICVFIWRGKYLFERNMLWANKMLSFFYDFTNSWNSQIKDLFQASSNSIETLKNIQSNKSLPIISEVVELKALLTFRMERLTEELKTKLNGINTEIVWNELAEITICLLCLFNSVDFQIIERMTIADYAVRPDWSEDDPQAYQHKMSAITYHLAKKRSIVCIETNNTEVVVLLTLEIKKAINVLISKRKHASVSQTNTYVFAKQFNDEESTFKAANCFYNLCIRPGVLSKDVLNNLKIRQFIGHITQISDMTSSELDWLKKYLSEDITFSLNSPMSLVISQGLQQNIMDADLAGVCNEENPHSDGRAMKQRDPLAQD